MASDKKPGPLSIWLNPASVVVRSTYLPGGTVYEAGRDFSKIRVMSAAPVWVDPWTMMTGHPGEDRFAGI